MKKPSGYVQFKGGKRNMKTTHATVMPTASKPKTRGPASKGMLREDLGKC